MLLQPYMIILTAVIVDEYPSVLPTDRILSSINMDFETVDMLLSTHFCIHREKYALQLYASHFRRDYASVSRAVFQLNIGITSVRNKVFFGARFYCALLTLQKAIHDVLRRQLLLTFNYHNIILYFIFLCFIF
jgi:hypothetical protein